MARVVMHADGVAGVQRAASDYAYSLTGEIAADVRMATPVLTGDLLSTVRRERLPLGGRLWVGDVARGIDYHLYVEYGTERMHAQPYVRPAVYRWRGL